MSIRTTHRAPPQRSKALAHAATALVSAAAGWWAHTPAPSAAAQPEPAAAAAPIASAAYTAPLIALSSDGNVTLRVEQQPLEWVLDQIALQGGGARARSPAPAPASPPAPSAAAAVAVTAAAPAPASCPEPAALAADPARVLRQIEAGSEAERFQALMLARSAAIAVPEPTLKRLYETSASEGVQVAAFEAYLALQADRPDALRAALEAAQHAPTAAVQREAGPRLAQLREVQRLNALPALTDP